MSNVSVCRGKRNNIFLAWVKTTLCQYSQTVVNFNTATPYVTYYALMVSPLRQGQKLRVGGDLFRELNSARCDWLTLRRCGATLVQSHFPSACKQLGSVVEVFGTFETELRSSAPEEAHSCSPMRRYLCWITCCAALNLDYYNRREVTRQF